jgi:acetyl esterase/lipase
MRPAVYRYGRHTDQFGELWRPDEAAAGRAPRGTVVILHGGFWRVRYGASLGRPLAADLVRRGYPVWNLEYRRVGRGGGWPATFADVAAGIDQLAQLPTELAIDTSRVVAVGHSAGGHLAAWAAGRAALPVGSPGAAPRVRLTGVVAQAGVLWLADSARAGVGGTAARDLMGGGPDDLPERYRLVDPAAAIPPPVPVLCVHARSDDEVPFDQSARYVEAAVGAGGPVSLAEAAGDHYTLIDPSSSDWSLVIDALPGLLGSP